MRKIAPLKRESRCLLKCITGGAGGERADVRHTYYVLGAVIHVDPSPADLGLSVTSPNKKMTLTCFQWRDGHHTAGRRWRARVFSWFACDCRPVWRLQKSGENVPRSHAPHPGSSTANVWHREGPLVTTTEPPSSSPPPASKVHNLLRRS